MFSTQSKTKIIILTKSILSFENICLCNLVEYKFGRMVKSQPFPKQTLIFTYLQYKSFKKSFGKEEIAQYEQFLLFPQSFQKACTARHV